MTALNGLQATVWSRLNLAAACQRFHWSGQWARLTSLSIGFSIVGGLWLTQTIAPAPVYAYTGTVSVAIDVQPGESYETLLRRAEAIARAATQRSFDRDILTTDVSIIIIAQTATSTVPVLSLAATRTQWRSQPDPRRWATYYSTSKQLLGLNSTPSSVPLTQPTVTPATATQAPPRSTQSSPTTTPKASSSGAAATGTQTSTSPQTPRPIIPKRIPTPANIGK